MLVGMDALPRVGKPTRQSLFIALQALHQAADCGWAEYHSASEETIIAFHPAFLPTYVQVRFDQYLPPEAITDVLRASGYNEPEVLSEEERARRATTALVRRVAFRNRLVHVYGERCAMCGLGSGLVQGAHIYPASAPGSPDELWNGLALCPNHHAAFDRHLIWVAPDSRAILLHPALRAAAPQDPACQSFIQATHSSVREPQSKALRPRAKMFARRYEYFRDSYSWPNELL